MSDRPPNVPPGAWEAFQRNQATRDAVRRAVLEGLVSVTDRMESGDLEKIDAVDFCDVAIRALVGEAPHLVCLPFVFLCQTEEHSHVLVAAAWEARRAGEQAADDAGLERSRRRGGP